MRLRLQFVLLLILLPSAGAQDAARTTNGSSPANVVRIKDRTAAEWAAAGAVTEKRLMDQVGTFSVRYLSRRRDAKGDVTRLSIDTSKGTISRLIARNGRPLTPAEDAAERARLQAILDHPYDYEHHYRKVEDNLQTTEALVKEMPGAMLWSFAPGQPQLENAEGQQIVLDFKPDPAYRPPSMLSDVLTGIEGRMWIDAASATLIYAEAKIVRPVTIGFGFIAKIESGGNVEFRQTHITEGIWLFDHVLLKSKVRIAFVKGIDLSSLVDYRDYQMLARVLDYHDAVKMLLAEKVSTAP